MIRSLKLRHWKSHEQSHLRFGKGTNVLVGPMGAGKTACLDAICFALYGTFPALKSRRVSLDDLVMKRPVAYDSAEVELEFEHAGSTYSIARTIGKKGSEAFIRKDGKFFDGPQAQRATEAVSNLLRVDYELFARAIYSEQNRLDYFLSLSPRERKKQIDELLGIDRFETARATAVSVANKLKQKRAELQSLLKGLNPALLREEHARLARAIRDLGGQLARALEQAAAAESSLSQASAELARLEGVHAKLLAQRSLAERAAAEAELLEKQSAVRFASEQALADNQTRLRATETELTAVRNQQSAVHRDLARLTAEKTVAEQKLLDAERMAAERSKLDAELKALGSRSSLETALAQARSALASSEDALRAARARELELENALQALAVESAACPVCDAPLSKDRHALLREQKRVALEKTRGELRTADASLRQAQERALSADDALRRLSLLEQKLPLVPAVDADAFAARARSAGDALARAQARADALAVSLRALERTAEELRVRVREGMDAQRLREDARIARGRHAAAVERVRELEKTFSESALRDARSRVTDAEKARVQWRGEADKAGALLADARERERRVGGQLAEAVAAEASLGVLDARVDGVLVFESALVDAQASLRALLVESINEAMVLLWPSVYPYGDYVGLRLRPSDEDYALELQALDGSWVPADNASGGERSCASLALRIAFAMVLTPNLSWLVLDEPTHNLDREAVLKLAAALRDEIPNIVQQVFLITHDDALKESASAHLYRIERDKDKGDRSIVEEVGITA